jgi:hypothetical protein
MEGVVDYLLNIAYIGTRQYASLGGARNLINAMHITDLA